MEFNAEVKKVTDPIYKKVSRTIPEIEWETSQGNRRRIGGNKNQ